MQIQTNLISLSHTYKVKKLILFGSSCIYPKHFKKKIKESQILTGSLEETNESYAIAKIAGIKMIEAFNKQFNSNYICLMPCNLFGPNDNYDTKNSHFLPALIKKIYFASKKKRNKIAKLWGTGKPLREVLHVDEVANACEFFLRKKIKGTLINIGSPIEMTIKEYANYIRKKIDPKVSIKFDNDKKLDGVMRKKLNLELASRYGWRPKMNFSNSIDKIIDDFKDSLK